MWRGLEADSFLVKPRRKMFHVVSVGQRDGDGHLFWECSFSPSSMFGNFLSLLILCPLIAASGHDAYFGMVGLPGLSGIGHRDPWATSFGDLASFSS